MTAPNFTPFEPPLSVPLALRSRRNWIGWRVVPDPDNPDSPKKMPVVLVPGVSTKDYLLPHAHVDYDEALLQVAPINLAGIGFVMTPDCGMIGGDMDKCRDPVTGVIEPWAQAVIDRKETYFEISPSGCGVRFFSFTDMPLRNAITFKPVGVELYSSGRYLTFTGARITGTSLEVHRAPYAVETLMKRAADGKAAAAAEKAAKSSGPGKAAPGSFEDKANREAYRRSPMGEINEAALKDMDAWVPELLPAAEKTADGGFRVKSKDLGRALQEDLSLHPTGIKDWGVHDLGDTRDGRRTPIDVVMEWSSPSMTNVEAAEWLGARVGVPFDSGGGSGGASSAGPTVDLEVFDTGDEKGDIEPRQWLLGTTFCRGYLSGLVSAGGSGKTTVRILQLLSLATGRALSGEHVFVRSRVLVVCLEDDMKELRRRVLAARLHHNVTAAEVKGWLFLTTPRGLKIAELAHKRVVVGGLYRSLVKVIEEKSLDLVCLDPAIKAHGLDESSNPEIDAFASLLADLAVEKNIGVDLLAHERKGLAGAGKVVGDLDRGRGATAMRDAQRLAKTLTGMNEKEAVDAGVADADRRFYVRVDDAKVNLAPSGAASWMKIVGVNLGNGNATYPSGDNVQTVETWTPTIGFTVNLAQATLWDAQSQGRRVRRGGQGTRHPDTAATILGGMLGWSPQDSKRAVAKLIEDKLAVVKTGKGRKRA